MTIRLIVAPKEAPQNSIPVIFVFAEPGGMRFTCHAEGVLLAGLKLQSVESRLDAIENICSTIRNMLIQFSGDNTAN